MELWQLDLIPLWGVMSILFIVTIGSTINSIISSFSEMEEPAGGHQAGKYRPSSA